MNFGGFLKLIQIVLKFAPNAGALLTKLLAAKTWAERLAIAGELLDTVIANQPAVQTAFQAEAVQAMSEEQENELAGVVSRQLWPDEYDAGAHESVKAQAFDLTKLKKIWALLGPFLPTLLKMIGFPTA